MASNFDLMQTLIKNTSGQENTLAVNKIYIKYMGSLEGGVFLSQLIYFSDKSKRNDGFFWKTYKDWYDHTFISEYNIKKIVNKMKEIGYLETKLIKAEGSPTLHYKLDMNCFLKDFESFLKNLSMENENLINEKENIDESLTKITTEITTKTTNKENNKKNKAVQQVELNLDFEEFWKIYPRKEVKHKALESFLKAIKKHDLTLIMKGTFKYAELCRIKNTETKFIAHPTTFLNQKRYLDDYDSLITEYQNNRNGGYNNGWNERPNGKPSVKETFGVELEF